MAFRIGSWRTAGRPAASPPHRPKGYVEIVEDSRLVPRSDPVIPREDLVAVDTKNLRLRDGMDG